MLVYPVKFKATSWQRLTTIVVISLSTITLSGCVVAHTPNNTDVRYGYVKSSPATTMATIRHESYPGDSVAEDENIAELDNALAPIALYPDSLLEHIFVAVTEPVDLIQAQSFIEQHNKLAPDEVVALAQNKPWDPSVIALLPFVDVVTNLTDDLEYLEYLGDMVEEDYALVASRLAYLRQQAKRSGHLTSDEYVKIIEKETKIYIESAQPEVVFVPIYSPVHVYGPWWHGYQPRVWHYRHTSRVGIHVSRGNVAINWRPFRYVNHQNWRNYYNIKQRHQLFSRRLQTSHRAHNVHRDAHWGSGKRLNGQRTKYPTRQVRDESVKRAPVKLPPKKISVKRTPVKDRVIRQVER